LRVRGVAHSPVPLVDAAPIGAQQAARDFGWLGCLEAGPGSNSERSARSARPSSRAAAVAGSRPVLGRTRPRYLTRSARVQVLFSCWASATAFCAASLSSSSLTGAGQDGPGRESARLRRRRASPRARLTLGSRRGCA
jgi:hypothetical protein